MKELYALAERFEVSDPVFRLTMSSRNDLVDANISHPVRLYRPIADESNVLDCVIVDCYSENFDIGLGIFTVDKERIAHQAMDVIRSHIRMFLERNLEMRNPRQSKIYRWTYRSMLNDTEFNNVLVMLYKYIRSFTNDDMRVGADQGPHVENVIALLIAMENKYNEQR